MLVNSSVYVSHLYIETVSNRNVTEQVRVAGGKWSLMRRMFVLSSDWITVISGHLYHHGSTSYSGHLLVATNGRPVSYHAPWNVLHIC